VGTARGRLPALHPETADLRAGGLQVPGARNRHRAIPAAPEQDGGHASSGAGGAGAAGGGGCRVASAEAPRAPRGGGPHPRGGRGGKSEGRGQAELVSRRFDAETTAACTGYGSSSWAQSLGLWDDSSIRVVTRWGGSSRSSSASRRL